MYFDEKSEGYLIHENLRLLFRLRNIAIAAQSATVLIAVLYLKMNLLITPILVAIAFLSFFNVYTRYRINRPQPIALYELVMQLSVDIIILTVLLGLSGGASNPFAILYLLPLTITAILLPARVTWGLAVLTVICYSLLLVVYVPMPQTHNHADMFGLHIVGMWLGFVLSAGVVAYFIVGLKKIIKKQAGALSRAKEQAYKNKQLIKLGVLAASTAHEMGTPLNSIALLVEDIEQDDAQLSPDLLNKTVVIREQITRCRDALASLNKSAGSVSLQGGGEVLLVDYLQGLIGNWHRQHPDTKIEFKLDDQNSNEAVMIDEVLNLALTNIIENAIEVSPRRVTVGASQQESHWLLTIRDYGPGMSEEELKQIGQQGYSTKDHGLGLGLFLSHSIIQRLGGMVNLYNHSGGGLCTDIQLPNKFQQVPI